MALGVEIGVELSVPRQASRMKSRSNPPSTCAEEYYWRSVFIPYIDSVMSSLQTRFAESNKTAFSLLRLHPVQMLKSTNEKFLSEAKILQEMYGIDSFAAECDTWFNLWTNRQQQDTACNLLADMDLINVLDHTKFFPAICHAIHLALALPATTCTIERSFSTLRRVKT